MRQLLAAFLFCKIIAAGKKRGVDLYPPGGIGSGSAGRHIESEEHTGE